MASVYGEEAAQGLRDEVWLRHVGERGWVVLMKDGAIRRRPAELEALIDAGVRAFSASRTRSCAVPSRRRDS